MTVQPIREKLRTAAAKQVSKKVAAAVRDQVSAFLFDSASQLNTQRGSVEALLFETVCEYAEP